MSESKDSLARRNVRPPDRYINQTGLSAGSGASEHDPVEIGDDEVITANNEDSRDDDYMPVTKPKGTTKKGVRGFQPKYLSLGLEGLRKEHAELRSTNKGLSDQLAAIKRDRTEIRKNRDYERSQRVEAQRDVRGAKQEIQRLRSEIAQRQRDHKAALDELRQDFHMAEQDLLAKIQKETFHCLPDNIIRERFSNLKSACTDWVLEWHSRELPENWPSQLEDIGSCWTNVTEEHGKRLLAARIQALQVLGLKIYCQGAVAWKIMHCFFKSPDHIFNYLEEGKKAFQTLRTAFAQVDTDKAVKWRAETVRCLKNQIESEQSQPNKDKGVSPRFRELCTNLAAELIRRNLSDCLKSNSAVEISERLKELEDIFVEAGLLALEIWIQEIDVSLVGASGILSQTYQHGSELYVPHRSMGLDEDDTSYDGQPLHLVVCPAVQARGTAGDDHATQTKFWSKAVVLSFDVLEQTHGSKKEDEASQSHVKRARTLSATDEQSPKRTRVEHDNPGPSSHNSSVAPATSDVPKKSIAQQFPIPQESVHAGVDGADKHGHEHRRAKSNTMEHADGQPASSDPRRSSTGNLQAQSSTRPENLKDLVIAAQAVWNVETKNDTKSVSRHGQRSEVGASKSKTAEEVKEISTQPSKPLPAPSPNSSASASPRKTIDGDKVDKPKDFVAIKSEPKD